MSSSRRASLSLGDLVKDLHPAGVFQPVLPGYMIDPVCWIKERCPHIDSKERGDVPFELWPYQEGIVRYFWDGGTYFIKKSRQRGMTTAILAGGAAHKLLYGKEVQGIPLHMHVVADTGDKAQELLRITKMALETATLTSDERARLTGTNLMQKSDVIRFGMDNYIRCHATKQAAVRGFPGNAALIEEAAAIEKLRALWRSMYAMVLKRLDDGTMPTVWVVSTPSTEGMTFFDELCEDAAKYSATYIPYDYRSVPGCDSAEWEKAARAALGDEDFDVEYALVSAGDNTPMFNTEVLKRFAEGRTWWGKEPIPGHRYSKGVDVSGAAGTTVFVATDVTERPFQPVCVEIISGTYAEKRKRIAALDAKYPGPLHADGTWSASFVGELDPLVAKLIPVRFTGGNDVGKSHDKTEQLTWAHWPRRRLTDGSQTLLHNGTVVVFEEALPKLWYALRKARRPRAGETSGESKREGTEESSDIMDAFMMSLIPYIPKRARNKDEGGGNMPRPIPSSPGLSNLRGKTW